MKFLIALLLIIAPTLSIAAEQTAPLPVQSCKVHIPFGMPSTKDKDKEKDKNTVICRKGYILDHNNTAKIPSWVSWTLTPEHALGCEPRVNAFAGDQSLPEKSRAVPSDYAKSGYDQGHIANNADMSWDVLVAKESFLMSNMSPQLPSVNRGVWKNLESAERAWVIERRHSFTIYAGNIWKVSSRTIGNGVVVPESLFKILIDDTSKQSYAYLIPNKEGTDKDFGKYQVTVSEIEKVGGLTFPVPDKKDVKNKIEEPNLKKFSEEKKANCKE